MKHHLNTLFVTTEGSYLVKRGQAVEVRFEKQTRLHVPLHNLDGIVCFGRVGHSPMLLGACADSGVRVSLLDRNGRFRAAVVGFTPGNVLLRRQQYRAADSLELALLIARNMVAAKIANARSVLLRAVRDAPNQASSSPLQQASTRLVAAIHTVQQVASLDELRGVEGESAATYFWGIRLSHKCFWTRISLYEPFPPSASRSSQRIALLFVRFARS